MTNGQAVAIIQDINSDKYTVNEKGLALHQILSMATTNGITKQEFKNALMWLWHQHFEMADPVGVIGEEGE